MSQLPPLAKQTMEFLDRVWKDKAVDDRTYMQAVATRVVVFIANTEATFAAVLQRLDAIEQKLGIAPAAAEQPAQPSEPAQPGANGNGNGAQVQQQQQPNPGGPPGPGWVRMDSNGDEMDAQSSAVEEKMDVAMHGHVLPERYKRIQAQQ